MHGLVNEGGDITAGWPDFAAWDPASWSALAAWTTASIAFAAALIALGQIRQAIKSRKAQAQPYVAVSVEPTVVSQQFINLVIKNMGNTAASNVKIAIVPSPRRSDGQGGVGDVAYPESIPTLVPGQEWRTLWDVSTDRSKTDLPGDHMATVSFNGPGQRSPYSFKYNLDWRFYSGRRWVEEYGVHHAAKALREIEKQVTKWREGPKGGIRVYSRDGDAKDEARRQEVRQFERERARRQAIADSETSSAALDVPSEGEGEPS